ncbi:hypothetical protein [Terriglobus sp.]|uniref:hypothetical protein n=1 Tax=Terriglobus sp. TaxID=1889013 RepID=UPI003B00B381
MNLFRNWRSSRVVVLLLLLACSACMRAQALSADLSGVKPGPVQVAATTTTLTATWHDAAHGQWVATFSLDPKQPLITSIAVNGKAVVRRATPWYRVSTGKRTGGWDAFFDFPPAASEGTRTFLDHFHVTSAAARTVGDRIEISFGGMELGIFQGDLRYTIYPGSSLIEQAAVLSTAEQNVAYTYDTGLFFTNDEDQTPGVNMHSTIAFYNADAKLQSITPAYGSERHTAFVHYRAIAARTGAGSIVAFPAPHRYLFARDYSTNMGYAWYSAWRGKVGIGIQQPLDDNTQIYPWINAPANTAQEMGVFLLLGSGTPEATLERALAYTHRDVFPHLDGYVTFAPHWHYAFTEQAIAKGPDWVPPFKPVLKSMGVDAAMIMDFHGDGHAADTTGLRFRELQQYYEQCRRQSDSSFLLLPAEEADVYLGGHWSLTFPKPVYWQMKRGPGEPFEAADPTYGKIYRVGSAEDMWRLVQTEHGLVYETHPRTKGSTGFPEAILNTSYFRDPRYFGVGWKAMPSDLSLPYLGARGFKVHDDLHNMGLPKAMVGEVDLFQVSPQDELYAHMNVNYVRLPSLPSADRGFDLLQHIAAKDSFVSTGEVLLTEHSIIADGANRIRVRAAVSHTFPLRLAYVVWGDGAATHTEVFPLDTTKEFATDHLDHTVNAPNWKWARLSVWDIAGGGAFTQASELKP